MGDTVNYFIKAVDQTSSGVESAVGTLKGFATRAAGMMGVSLSVAGIVQFTRQIGAYVEQIKGAASATGFTMGFLQQVGQIAQENEMSFGSLNMMLMRMRRVMSEMDTNKNMQKALREIGLEAKDLKGLSPDAFFEQIANAVVKLGDDTRATTALISIFGRGATRILATLKDLGSAKKISVIEDAEIKKIDEAADKIGRIKQWVLAKGAGVIAAVLPPEEGSEEDQKIKADKWVHKRAKELEAAENASPGRSWGNTPSSDKNRFLVQAAKEWNASVEMGNRLRGLGAAGGAAGGAAEDSETRDATPEEAKQAQEAMDAEVKGYKDAIYQRGKVSKDAQRQMEADTRTAAKEEQSTIKDRYTKQIDAAKEMSRTYSEQAKTLQEVLTTPGGVKQYYDAQKKAAKDHDKIVELARRGSEDFIAGRDPSKKEALAMKQVSAEHMAEMEKAKADRLQESMNAHLAAIEAGVSEWSSYVIK